MVPPPAALPMSFDAPHCSWMPQVEQWLRILQRQRLRVGDFATKAARHAKIVPCMAAWNPQAPPCHWSTKSVAKGMAEVPLAIAV